MELKKLKLRKLDISTMSERELNNVFGGMAAPATIVCRTAININTYCYSGDVDTLYTDSDTDRVEDFALTVLS